MSWDKNELFVKDSLKRLEDGQQELFEFIRDHMAREEATTQEIRERLIKLEMDTKWHVRIFSSVTSVAAAAVAFVAGKYFE